ncbi:putative secreted protein (Por secretion system target) [Nonlabens dokdonensis]|jgi:hypothetical protein|uniref:Glycosyl hydrolase, family 16 n=2 Tax=Nonlabens dokdonensis TaxID=328515 RepID=L7WDJ8_NONDD|nr:discoidin domain-containing protein [Nonlabens dokdonensis]AGC78021.1 glycosyl hydrolase, family 16 [Nonlabens dokdonensis DSW-6]PZX37089.1 putative secreted protein (Por secretion system target) [Nonlabens dokdonensis]
MKKITIFLFVFIVFEFATAQNLALNGTATASSVENGGTLAVNANDGNAATRWASSFSDPEWITIDLGASFDIGRVVLNWEGAFGSSYEIQISNDPTFTTFTTAFTTTTGDGGIDDISVSETGRYVRMYGTVRGTPFGYSLWEFEIYEAVDPLIDTSLSDLTVNGSTVAGFSSSTLDYNILLPIGTTVVPTVVATAAQASPATAVVTNAASLPGVTSILVTAQNGTDTNTYTISFTVEITPVNQTFDLTFEPGSVGSVATNWNVFENDSNPPFEVVSNPDATGVNTSPTVAKLITLTAGEPFAGCETQHGTIWKWVLDGTTTTITIDVYKTVISDVGIKMVNETSGTIFQLLQPNTVTNAWETLTYDITSAITSGDNNDVDQIVVFTDWQPRTSDNISYFDNISWEGLKLAEAPLLSIPTMDTTVIKVYPNPTQQVWNVTSSNQVLNSIEVFDVLGKQVLSLRPNANDTIIDATALTNGLYIAKITTDTGSKSLKLLKK